MSVEKITIKDMAQRLNLSVSTISRALSDHHSIGKSTKEKVKKLAKEVGYFPNSVASNLRQRKTHSLGVIVPRIDIYFHSLVISGIEEIAYSAGYSVTIYQTKDSLEREIEVTRNLHENRVAGIIACISLETDNFNHFEEFNLYNVPVVFYDRVPNNSTGSKVLIDDYEAAFKATEHLISINCRKIAHIAGNQKMSIFQNRLKGYKNALTKNGLEVSEDLIAYTNDLSYEEGIECAQKFINGKVLPDGIFCANDSTAISTIQVLKKANYEIPEDIAVVGFSNYPISKIVDPNLTTVNDRAFEMGQTAANLLIRQIEDKNEIISSETIVLKTELLIRDSTKRTKKKET